MIIGMEEPSSVDRVQDNLDRVFGLLVFCVILEAISLVILIGLVIDNG
jgi:hypothetical protein